MNILEIFALAGIMILILVVVILILAGFVSKKPDIHSAEEARRLARRLVSEIELSSERKIAKASADNNIYGALRGEIERARDRYKRRVSQTDHFKYFDEALIEILARGEREKLGKIYPD